MDPLGGLRSSVSQAHKTAKSVESRVKRAKSVQKKAARLDKALVLHFLIFFGAGVVLGLSYFMPFGNPDLGALNIIFIINGGVALLLGFLHQKRILRKFDWAEYGDVWPEFMITFCGALFVFGGSLLLWVILPLVGLKNGVSLTYQLIGASSLILFLLPNLIQAAHVRALEIQPYKYKVWHFPNRPLNHDPRWNPDRIVFANLKFSKSLNDKVETTVKARLPVEAEFGQLLHLFFLDYNENRSPDSPVQDIGGPDKGIGWLFYASSRMGKRVFDPDKTILDNGIKEDDTIFMTRVTPEE